MTLKEQLQKLPGLEAYFDAPMAAHTTYKTGGPAEALVMPKNSGQLADIIALARALNAPWRVMGAGSNILVSDKGLLGITICLKKMANGIEHDDNTISALAGEPLDNVVSWAVELGLEGLESLSGIPGSVGGAVFMNAGAYGQSTFDRLLCLDVMDQSGQIKTMFKSDFAPKYRRVDELDGLIVLDATWELKHATNPTALKARREEVLAARKAKQPLDSPSAGSVFKRPQGNFASALIDECGLKGLTVGGAQVSPKHAGFIVNTGGASATDIKNLMQEVQKRVWQQKGIKLELEQILWGFDNA